jgi:GT2 family glycosyltransferase
LTPEPAEAGRSWPAVSVIVLTHNGGQFIGGLLDSLADQSYPKDMMEVLVVDNASSDDTREIAQARPFARFIALEDNLGYAAGNNLAVGHASHDTLAFLNQDVICHRDWLAGLVAALMDHEEAGAVTSNMVMPWCAEYQAKERFRPLDVLYYVDLSCFGYGAFKRNGTDALVHPRIISGCAFCLRRRTVEEQGKLFEEDLRMYVEDTDLSLRLRNMGLEVLAVRASVVYHLHEGAPEINQRRLAIGMRAIMNRVYVYYKNMSTPEFWAYLPLLALGGPMKIFEMPLNPMKRALYFVPFALLSLGCMAAALCTLGRFRQARGKALGSRRGGTFHLLRQLFQRTA